MLNGTGGGPRTPFNQSGTGPLDLTFFEPSCKQDPNATGSLWFNAATDVTIPERRFGISNTTLGGGIPFDTIPIGGTQFMFTYPRLADQLKSHSSSFGDDILLTNVVSFTVQVLVTKLPGPTTPTTADFVNLFDASIPSAAAQNPQLSTSTVMPPVRVFDTWSKNTSPPYDYSQGGPTPYNATRVLSMLSQSGGNATAVLPPTAVDPGLPVGATITIAGADQAGYNGGPFTVTSAAIDPITGQQSIQYGGVPPATPSPATGAAITITLPNQNCVPLQIRVGAVQIILRVWDEKTERTRQITIVQNM